MTPRRLALFLCLLLASRGVFAEEQRERLPLTLQEALDRACLSSARLSQLRSFGEAADAGLRGARAGRWPQLELSATYSRLSNVPEFSVQFPGEAAPRTLFPDIPDQFRTRASLTQPLYTGGRVAGSIAQAEAQQEAARRELLGGHNDLLLETRSAYWGLLAARESARVLSEAIAAFESHLRDAVNRQRFGLAARNEVLLVQVERDRAELQRLQAENAAEVAHANLARLTGLAPGTRIEPTEPKAAPAQERPPLEALVAQAFAARPELQALRARIAAAEAAARVARAGGLPQATLSAGYEYARPVTRILPLEPEWNGTWSLSANLSWSAFDGGRIAAATAQARAQAEATRRQLEDLEQRLRLEVTARMLDVQTAAAAGAVAARNLEAAAESLRVARDRYREGVASSSDLLDAETALLRAGLDETQAAVQARLAAANLERAIGQ